jgi:spermidine synthase
MAHVPLMALASPKRVLVIGGGDGGVLREVLKHASVAKATLCEIDRAVIDLSLKHYPQIADGCLDDARADVVIADGLKYVAETREKFDAIIVDSSEPIGPSAVLHTREFFTDCKRALKSGGVLVTQNGLPFLFPEHLRATTEIFASLFERAAPYICTQPCYFGGPFALNWASDDAGLLAIAEATLARRMAKRGITARYYTPAVHRAAFALPGYVAATVEGLDGEGKSPAKSSASARKRPARKVSRR